MAKEIIPVVPKFIKVHLGRPENTSAENITVPFPYYISNVASSEIYPTWPISAIEANMYVIISYAMNRVYTEWYRNQGYDFDITNSTAFDQAFVKDRDIFKNISTLADEIFNNYIRRKGTIEPLFASFCNGTTVTCDGLSQWGTVPLAEEGKSYFEILQYYYGEDIEMVKNAPVSDNTQSYPGNPVRVGDIGNDVATIQIKLNRIGENYPSIPKIEVDGVFAQETEKAVKEFQRIFNLTPDGIVGKSTWYKINYIYTGVKELGELSSEGIGIEDIERPFTSDLKRGSYGVEVKALQYYLNFLSYFISDIPSVVVDGVFGKNTEDAVKAFQKMNDLVPTGIFNISLVRLIDQKYKDIVDKLPPETYKQFPDIYPGYVLTLGLKNDRVSLMQKYLKKISENLDFVPPVEVTNVFDEQTSQAVRAIQKKFDIPNSGTIGPVTWFQIVQLYNEYK